MEETDVQFRPGPQCPRREVLEAFAAGAVIEPSDVAHVSSCDRCESFLRLVRGVSLDIKPLLRRLDETAATNDRAVMEVAVDGSDLVPGYRIVEEIGEGGQGTVFRAVQESTKQPVALKLLRAGRFASSQQRARVEREAELVASLRHPGIVVLHDRLTAKGGQLAIVMEYIDGVPFDRWKPKSERSADQEREMLRVFVRVCEAVAFAHRNGVIHRDLKPSNILVDGDAQPHLLDFGIAKALDQRHAELTMTGDALFTPAYASPEQVMQDTTDTLTDVYSLGVILYKLLCDRFPYAVEGSIRDVVTSICERDPVPPRMWKPTLDADLETIVLRALQKERGRRYGSVAELGADVDRYLRRLPIQAKRDSLLYVLRLWAYRHRIRLALVGVVVGILATAGGWVYFSAKGEAAAKAHAESETREKDAANARARESERTNRESFARSEASSQIARQLVEGAERSLRPGVPATSQAPRPVSIKDRIEFMLITADLSVTGSRPETLAYMSNELAIIATSAGLFSAAESALLQTIRTRSSSPNVDKAAVASARHDLAELYLYQGPAYLSLAAENARAAMQARAALFGASSHEVAAGWEQWARICWAEEDPAGARESIGRAEAALPDETDPRMPRLRARLLRTHAMFVGGSGAGVAEELLRAALRLLLREHGDRDPQAIETMRELGMVLRSMDGSPERAEEGRRWIVAASSFAAPKDAAAFLDAWTDLIELKENLLGDRLDPSLAETHVALAVQWMIANNFGCAAESFRRALDVLRALGPGAQDAVLNCLEQVALCERIAEPKSPEREDAVVEAYSLWLQLRSSDPDDGSLPETYFRRTRDLAQAIRERGGPLDAVATFDLAMRRASGSPFAERTASLWEETGWTLVCGRELGDGAKALEASVAAYVSLQTTNARARWRASARLAAARFLEGDVAKGEEVLERLEQNWLGAGGGKLADHDTREALGIVHQSYRDRRMYSRADRFRTLMSAAGLK